jgi:hypothetical protein
MSLGAPRPPAALLVVSLLLTVTLACYATKAEDPPTGGTGGAGATGGPKGGSGGGAPGDGGTADGPSDNGGGLDGGGGDRPVSTTVAAYRQLLDDKQKIWSERWAECFNSPPEGLTADRSPLFDDIFELHAFSLDHGLVAIDDAKAQACLDALMTVSCEELATGAYQATCAEALAGKVASNGFCASPEDCASAADACQRKSATGCTTRCTPRPAAVAVDQICMDRPCGAGAVCYVAAGQNEPRCHPLDAEGASCPDQTCVAGAWCQPAAPDATAGTCQRVQAGAACQGTWQCPFPYTCLIAAGATSGTCGPGRKLGEDCALNGLMALGGPYSDCASPLFCFPDDAGKYRCALGHEVGESCADIDVGGGVILTVPCRQGSCRLGANGDLACVLEGAEGADCSAEAPCAAGLSCDAGKCQSTQVGLGERCTVDGARTCPPEARCATTAANRFEGTCTQLKAVGEPCADPQDCVFGATCTAGTCAACM